MIKYLETNNDIELPEIEGYKPQFNKVEILSRPEIQEEIQTEEPEIQEEEPEVEETKPDKTNWSDIKSVIIGNEGFVPVAKSSFNEPYATVGYGFFNVLPDGRKVFPGMTITKEESNKQLDIAIDKLSNHIQTSLNKYNLQTSPEQFNVLIDLGYHAGTGIVDKLLKESNGDSTKIGSLLLRYATTAKYGDKSISQGLKNRALRRSQAWNKYILKGKFGLKLPKFQNSGKLPFWSRLARQLQSAPSNGETTIAAHNADLNRQVELAREEGKSEDEVYKRGLLGTLGGMAVGQLSLPIVSDFAKYGLLGGGMRLGAGTVVGQVGEKSLGALGKYADKKLNTKWIEPTSKIIGGLAGFGVGSNLANRGLRGLAANDITMHIPQETFMKLRGEAFNRAGNKAVKSLLNNKHEVNPETQLMKQIVDVPEGKGWQFHIDDFFKRVDTDIDTGRVISTSHPKQHIVNNRIVPGESPWGSENNYIWFKEDKPYVNPYHSNILKGLSSHLETKYNLPVNGEPNRFPLTRGFNIGAPSIESYEYVPLNVVKVRDSWNRKLFHNEINGTWGRVKYYTNPKQTRIISEGTYPVYSGPKHSIIEVVNTDGTVNPRAALNIQREVADNIPGAYRMELRLENPEWHVTDPNTWEHTKNVARSAWSIPNPNGISKQDQMVAALGHDFGKIVAGEGHGPIGADLLEQTFTDITPEQLTAIREHMGNPTTTLGHITKQADVLNGKLFRPTAKSITDAEWDAAYKAAVESGDITEAQRLRDLHFLSKAPGTKIINESGMPKEVYHGSKDKKFTIFDSSKTRPDYDYGTSTNMFSDNKNIALGYASNDPEGLRSVYLNLENIAKRDFKGNPWNGAVEHTGKYHIVPQYDRVYSSREEAEEALQKILDKYYPNNPAKQAEQRQYIYVAERGDIAHPEKSTNAFSDEIAKDATLDGGIAHNVKDYFELPNPDENPELYEELVSPHTDFFVKKPENIKSSAAITYDDTGKIIPLSKRDNFSNPDIRYGIIPLSILGGSTILNLNKKPNSK